MIGSTRRTSALLFILTILLVVSGLFLRLYHREQAMYYMNDQGLLLLTTYDVLFSHHMPRVGPPISLAGVSIPPLMYAIVALFELVGSSPLVVASGYIVLNMAAGAALAYYAYLVWDRWTALITLGLVMVSASMVENGRSIWQAHPTFFFVAAYLLLTEFAYRKKNIWLYGIGLLTYVFAAASYPTPLLLIFFVFARTAVHFRSFGGTLQRQSRWSAGFLIAGLGVAVVVPWAVHDVSIQQSTVTGILNLLTSLVPPLGMAQAMYSYANNAVHDLFQLWILLPTGIVGSFWVKLAAGGLIGFMLSTFGTKAVVSGFRTLIHSRYHWLFVGLIIPAAYGVKLPAYRLLPFYPFIFVLFAWWIRSWISSPVGLRRFTVYFVILLYVVGNGLSWRYTTMTRPRKQYEAVMRVANTISSDVVIRHLPVSQIGVHYFTPLDAYDYYASPVYYLLHRSIHYPVSYTPLGNELRRGEPEIREFVYLVCDGFEATDNLSGCIRPYLARWNDYIALRTYRVSAATEIVVFRRSPS